MKKTYRLIFENENYELHKKVKSAAPLLEETINEFIMTANREQIEKIESKKSSKKLHKKKNAFWGVKGGTTPPRLVYYRWCEKSVQKLG